MKSIILAGASRSGKTTLARRLQKETGFSLISGDALMCTFQSIYPDLGISHEGDWNTVCKNWEDFIVVYLNHLVTYENIPFIFDTFHFLPEQIARLNLHKKYNVLFLGYPTLSGEEKLQHIRTYKTDHYDWTDEEKDDAALLSTITSFVERSKYLQHECTVHGLPFIDTGKNFHETIETAYESIMQRSH